MRWTRIMPDVSQPATWPSGREPDDGSFSAIFTPISPRGLRVDAASGGEHPDSTPGHVPIVGPDDARGPDDCGRREPRNTLTSVGSEASAGEVPVARRRRGHEPRLRRWERHVVVHATVHHPVEAVFPYLADPMRWHEFAPAVAFRRQIDEGPVRVGTRWMSTDRIGPFRAHFIDTLEHLDENRRVVWLSSAPWNARVEYACHGTGAVTRIRADYFGDLSGDLRWQAGWLPRWATHLILAGDFRRLDRVLTRRVRAARRWEQHHEAPTS
ncbi:hypothetical protein ESO86_10770 [Agromyces binzhouensis]|uniref:SRPBCC family protein n=1 Tax=Agromyces binzhouensis TaxID=1817495 RepID=A0A4Q2JIE2_9MICO|nr:hypothetical protein ESO86_10770 [Agromyces binzhouensis]